MKKFFAMMAFGLALATTACADNEIISRNVNDLPAEARATLNEQFAQTKVNYIKIDKEVFTTTYDVLLENGIEVTFDSKGRWKEVDGKKKAIPTSFVPQPIQDYAKSLFPEQQISKIEKDKDGRGYYEVELTNGVDFKFDKKFRLREVD